MNQHNQELSKTKMSLKQTIHLEQHCHQQIQKCGDL